MIQGITRILTPRPAPAEEAAEGKFANQHGARRGAYPRRSSAALSGQQKARLSILSRQAFFAVNHREPADQAEADAFRHEHVERATGANGLRACGQTDYKILEAHFLELAGESGQAMNAHLAHESEPARVAMAKLRAICKEAGLNMAYPAAICRTQYKCGLEDATVNQLWRLFYTVKNRGAAKARKGTSKTTKSEDPF